MSAIGYPDYQRITQWLGSPLVQNTGLVIGAGTHVDGPLEVANFAAIVVALKATGGNVTVTVKQTIQGGPASLILTQQVVVPAGSTLFEAFVLFGTAVEVDLTGSVAGTSVDYALYGSNTTTNAQVITAATINVQHNDVLVAAEATLDFEDATGFAWSIVDDAPNTRVKITPPTPPGTLLDSASFIGALITVPVAGVTLLTGAGATYDGSPVEIDVYIPRLLSSANTPVIELLRDGVAIAQVGASGIGSSQRLYFVDTPSAGAHTYSVKAFTDAGTASIDTNDGALGAGGVTHTPMTMRVKKQ